INNKNKIMTRENVYKLIDGEREYQDSFIADPKNDRSEGVNAYKNRTVGEELILIDTYLRRAKDAWSDTPSDTAALAIIRKISGLCVRCMENHDTPARQYLKPPSTND